MRNYITNAFLILALLGPTNLMPQVAFGSLGEDTLGPNLSSQIAISSVEEGGALNLEPAKIKVMVTAYSSTPDQTDSTPFTTASGTRVRDGIIAANFLKFGTKIKIPELFGNKIFIVEDRMHRRFDKYVDVWFPNRSSALKFGKQEVEIVVL